MELKLQIDDRETLEKLKDLSKEDIVTAWSEAILQLAVEHAQTKIGGNFGMQISRYIELEQKGDHAEIRMDRQNGYIGEHVQTGGPIRTRDGKPLAIPLPGNKNRKLFARNIEGLFRLKSKRGNVLLFKKPGKGKPLEAPLFVLKDQTRPQRPRPWWPEQAEAEAGTVRFFKENL